jgi:hypothetical protein
MTSEAMPDPLEAMRLRMNGETGRIGWSELQRHFARGVLIKVDAQLDLVDVAACVAGDAKESIAAWLSEGQLARADTEDALDWQARQPVFWAVVTAPWVLVQEIGARAE